ncbi:hypothetical protein EJB05_49182, partial [Eragrostis curvula]
MERLGATLDNGEPIVVMSPQNVSLAMVEAFDDAVGVLLDATIEYAVTNSSRRFATAEEGFHSSNPPSIYRMAQCTPDMSPPDCRKCLEVLSSKMRSLSGRQNGWLGGLRCHLRYAVYYFFYEAPMLQLPAPPVPAPTPSPVKTPTSGAYPNDTESIDSLLLNISTLRAATGNFDDRNKLGEGGFGAVYKGVLPDGQEIAVKRLSRSSEQGIEELKNELVLVAKLQHKNLVRLVGVCLQEHEKLLVYEYMPNRSIDTILFDPEERKVLDWEKRFRLINGIARGLQYLHEDSQLKIIHRDLKASNILLDSDYTPKISDFGLARLFAGDQSREITNCVVGTYGYMAPEYAMRGHYSMKSDVFSFGVLILEILSGRSSTRSFNVEQSIDLLSLVWQHWTAGTLTEILDSSLRGNINAPADQIVKCVHIGLLCVQEHPVDRPMMSTVNIMLSDSITSLQAPSKPVFIPTASLSAGMSGAVSLNEVSVTEPEPR